jgi:hypothetical protein
VRPESPYWQLDPAEAPVAVDSPASSPARLPRAGAAPPVRDAVKWGGRVTAFGAFLALSALLAGLLAHGHDVNPERSRSEPPEARAEHRQDADQPRPTAHRPPNGRAYRGASATQAGDLARNATRRSSARRSNAPPEPAPAPPTSTPSPASLATPLEGPPLRVSPGADAEPMPAEGSSVSDFAFGASGDG